MDGSVPTIRIVDEDVPGGRLINAADFDPTTQTKFEDTAAAATPKAKGKGGRKADVPPGNPDE